MRSRTGAVLWDINYVAKLESRAVYRMCLPSQSQSTAVHEPVSLPLSEGSDLVRKASLQLHVALTKQNPVEKKR